MAPRRRCLGAHADGGRRGQEAPRRARPPACGGHDAERAVPRHGQTADDAIRGMAAFDPRVTKAGVAPATAFLDRLNIHSIGGYDVRHTVLGIVAHHLKPSMPQVAHASSVTARSAAGAEGRSRTAGAICQSRLSWSNGHVRLQSDGLVSRTRSRAGGGAPPPAPLLLGRHIRTGRAARTCSGRAAQGRLRKAVGWRDRDVRGCVGRCEGATRLWSVARATFRDRRCTSTSRGFLRLESDRPIHQQLNAAHPQVGTNAAAVIRTNHGRDARGLERTLRQIRIDVIESARMTTIADLQREIAATGSGLVLVLFR